MIKKIIRITLPYWKSADKKKAYGLLLLAVAFTFGVVYSQYLMATWNQEFYDSMQKSDLSVFYTAVKGFVMITALVVVVTGLQYFFAEHLGTRWRKGLTKYCLDRWLSNGNHYFWNHIPDQGDNPDQRITEDVAAFTKGALTLGLEILKQVITMGAFITMLWTLSSSHKVLGTTVPGYLVWVSLAYAIVGTTLSHFMGRKIVPLNFNQQGQEADFRFQLMRIRENSESILLMKGNNAERKKALATFGKAINNYYQLISKQTNLTMFSSLYTNMGLVFPFLIAAPAFFAKEVTLGQIFQTGTAFAFVNGAMSCFVTLYASVANWSSVVSRLDGFLDAMDRAEALQKQTHAKISLGDDISVENLQISFPEVAKGLPNITSYVQAGGSMMVTGASGSGKSTLLRVFAGIWPFFEGKVTVPTTQKSMMLPQKPYLPIGTLRGAIAYPHDPTRLPSNEVEELLEFSGLSKLIALLDVEQHWSQVLSPGEQQRLGWIRVFLQKPDHLFLDEATSALDETMQAKMYERLKKRLPNTTIISVAHRSELMAYHGQALDLPSSAHQDLEKVG